MSKFIINDPPLKEVIIDFNFTENINLKLSQGNKIYERIKKWYSKEPNLMLHPAQTSFMVGFGPKTGLLFTDQKNENILIVGNDGVKFICRKYTRWNQLCSKVIDTIKILESVCSIKEFKSIKMNYIDEFIIERQHFKLDKFFDVSINLPNGLKPQYHDFHLGFVPEDDETYKTIIKIRGVKPPSGDVYKILLDSWLNFKKIIQLENFDNLSEVMSEMHDKINQYFIELVSTEDMISLIGLEIENE